MAREINADVHKPWWVQGCADPKRLGPKGLLYVYGVYWILQIYISSLDF